MSQWFLTYGLAKVHEGLIIGAYPLDGDDVAILAGMGVERMLNLVEDQEYPPGSRDEVEDALAAAGIEEYRMDLTDFGHLPFDALEAAVTEVAAWLRDGELCYVHCRAGRQRSAAVAAGVIAVLDGVGIEEALHEVQKHKPSADPLPHQREDLWTWWSQRSGSHRR